MWIKILDTVDGLYLSYGIHTNPAKSELIPFSNEDRLVVLAERQ